MANETRSDTLKSGKPMLLVAALRLGLHEEKKQMDLDAIKEEILERSSTVIGLIPRVATNLVSSGEALILAAPDAHKGGK